MPITVIKSRPAHKRCIHAVYKPPETIHIILNKSERQPPEDEVVTTFLPKGNSVSIPILKHCNPKGMPMMVIQKTKPITKYPSADTKPPKTNHIKLPNAFMV